MLKNEFIIKGTRGELSIKNLIKTAFEPVGRVMYIYGGGWNEADDGAGREAVTLGLSEEWLDFEHKQDGSYNHRDYDYKSDVSVIHLGLDCSAYVGWVIHNVFNDGKGYVTKSCNMDDMLAAMGYGKVTYRENVKEHRAGDIMASSCVGENNSMHVYISLGQCSDGSVLLLHSSPPGVQLSGTYTPDGFKGSQAVNLAESYMKKYYYNWYLRYPDSSRNEGYLTHYDRFEWSVLSDDEGYGDMTPECILRDIFEE